jgi:hypothetical protein
MSKFEVVDPYKSEDIQVLESSLTLDIKDYVSKYNPKLYILTPCYGGVCHVSFTTAIISTIELFRNLGIELKIEFCRNDSLITRARNNLIAKAMNDKTMTHVLFIDSDITWCPSDILKLLISEKPIIGGIYPQKKYYFENLLTKPNDQNYIDSIISKRDKGYLKDINSDVDTVRYNLVKYNINYLGNVMNIEKNLTKLRHIPTGFMMIQRDTLDKMFAFYPSTKYVDDVGFLNGTENDYAFALFDCGIEEGHYLSEDWMFCERWHKMGGDIYADVSINLTHSGLEDYKGSFLSSVM